MSKYNTCFRVSKFVIGEITEMNAEFVGKGAQKKGKEEKRENLNAQQFVELEGDE